MSELTVKQALDLGFKVLFDAAQKMPQARCDDQTEVKTEVESEAKREVLSELKILLSHATDLSFTQLITKDDSCLSESQLAQYNQLVAKRATGVPIAYLVGSQPFWTLDLKVSEHTLIPRQDTETLVQAALDLPLCANASVLDLGTGTGAVALALASERPTWQVSACDFKQEIVDLAKQNAKANQVDIDVVKSDWFCAIGDKRFDLIISNPPYIEPDSPYLETGDLRFEPLSALSAKNDGFADFEHIIKHAPQYMKKGAYIAFEHGYQQASKLAHILSEAGFCDVQTIQDLNQLDRGDAGQICIVGLSLSCTI